MDNYIGGDTTTGYASPGGFNAQTVPLIYPYGLAWNGDMTVLYISEIDAHMIVAWNRNTNSTSVFAGVMYLCERSFQLFSNMNHRLGTGTGSFSGDGGQATAATIKGPAMLFYENTSNVLYFGDYLNQKIRKVDVATGIISTLVRRLSLCYWLINIFYILQFTGSGCQSIFVAPNGESWIADTFNHLIVYRAIDGTTSTYAGISGNAGYLGIELTVCNQMVILNCFVYRRRCCCYKYSA